MSEILNQVLADFENTRLFAEESLTVLDPQGKLVRMKYRNSQRVLDEAIAKIRKRRRPVRLVILKSRRAGFSTGVAATLFKETPFRGGQKTLIVAQDKDAVTDSLFPMYDRFNTHYRPFRNIIALPKLTSDRKDGLDWENDSSISIQTAKNLEGTRSFGFRRVHLSEYAFYPHAKTLMTALMQTVPADPDTIVIVESTANGLGNDFHKLYERAKSGKTEWVALFFPWKDDDTCVMPLDCPPDRFQASLDDDERLLMLKYNLSLEQLSFRRWKIANDFEGDARMFQQEYPINDTEAFLVSGRPRFSIDAINWQSPVEGKTGELLFEQIGLREELVFRPNPRGALTVWKKPEPHRHYVIGADPSSGVDINLGVGTPDPDFSVADVGEREMREQVAQLRERIQPAAFGDYLVALGRWYNWAYLVIEVNSKIGVATIERVLQLGYPPERIYKRKYLDKKGQPVTEKYGWYETESTRVQLISYLDTALNQKDIILNSEQTISELYSFVIKPSGRPEAAESSHDDTVFSAGLMVVGFNQAPIFAHASARQVEVVRAATTRQRVHESFYGRSQEDDDDE